MAARHSLAVVAALVLACAAKAQTLPAAPTVSPTPENLVQFARGLPRQPGYEKSGTTRSGLPNLFTVGLEYALASESLRASLPRLAEAYRKDADAGDPVAQASLGRMYAIGAGVPQSDQEAYKWIKQAVDKGEVTSQVNLGNMYYQGTGVAKDVDEAVRWYQSGSEHGDVMAMANLGLLYMLGAGVRRDAEEGVRLLRQSAERGEPYSALHLGNSYELGMGVPADPLLSQQWLRKAAGIWRDLDARYHLPVSERARRFFVQSQAAVREKKFAEAAMLLQSAVTYAPWSPMGWYNRALVQAEVGEFGSAVVNMHMFLYLAPDAPQACGGQDLIYEWERNVKK